MAVSGNTETIASDRSAHFEGLNWQSGVTMQCDVDHHSEPRSLGR
jgi:hypothetical protein